jgi:serine/threonine protein kinase
MVAFYILTKGKHPFGEGEQVRTNLLAANPVNLKMLDGHLFAKDLISWMLSKDPKDRPSAEEALQHPYLKSKEQQFKLLWGMGNYVKRKDANSDVLEKLNENETDWKTRVDNDVLEYLSYDKAKKRKYEYTSWADCLRLKEHWDDCLRTEPEAIKVGDPQEYFLSFLPDLVLRVYKIARSRDDLKELPGLKEYFKEQ